MMMRISRELGEVRREGDVTRYLEYPYIRVPPVFPPSGAGKGKESESRSPPRQKQTGPKIKA